MIVYNVERYWFTMKADAEAHRRSMNLPPSATFKLTIENRDDLARLLNGLSGIEPEPGEGQESLPAPPEVVERAAVKVPEYIPRFLLRDHGL